MSDMEKVNEWCPHALQGGYRGFYSQNTTDLSPKFVNDIHKRGGTILGTSRGGHDTSKIVDSIEDRGINQVKAATSGHKSLSGSQFLTQIWAIF
jgi:6-phosphofructokinase